MNDLIALVKKLEKDIHNQHGDVKRLQSLIENCAGCWKPTHLVRVNTHQVKLNWRLICRRLVGGSSTQELLHPIEYFIENVYQLTKQFQSPIQWNTFWCTEKPDWIKFYFKFMLTLQLLSFRKRAQPDIKFNCFFLQNTKWYRACLFCNNSSARVLQPTCRICFVTSQKRNKIDADVLLHE